jgi:hypothetical protein
MLEMPRLEAEVGEFKLHRSALQRGILTSVNVTAFEQGLRE